MRGFRQALQEDVADDNVHTLHSNLLTAMRSATGSITAAGVS